jgi:hypothetical protein
MGFRFQRRVRLLPGVRINLSKSGVSTSIGGRGAWLTFGRRGTRATVGLPGTGLSYTTTGTSAAPPATAPAPGSEPATTAGNPRRGMVWLLVLFIGIAYLAWRALS